MTSSVKKPIILATRSLPDSELVRLEESGLQVHQLDFIKVNREYDENSFYQRLHCENTQARIFTSKNAVYSLRELAEKRALSLPEKKTFTVGIKATEMLAELGIKSKVRADNAISLAQIIARNDDVQSVDFFCGDKSLDDLPEYLESKNIKVNKEIVYKTELVQHQIDTSAVAAVIFLSPTAVFSFFKKNELQPEVPTFCIGATTGEAIRLRCSNPRIPSQEPSLESVVDKVIEYFN
jgi:uroporphyrinogen-III synthase